MIAGARPGDALRVTIAQILSSVGRRLADRKETTGIFLFDKTLFPFFCLIGKEGHAGFHLAEREFAVKIFLAGRGIEDKITAGELLGQVLDNTFSDPLSLEFGFHGNVVDGSLAYPVGDGAAKTDHRAFLENKDDSLAVLKDFLFFFGRVKGHANGL